METNETFGSEKPMRHGNIDNRIIIGIILLIVGLFLVMRNTGIFPGFIDNIVFSWQMLLIAIGLIITLGSSGNRSAGVIVMAVGGFLLIPMIFRETFHVNMFWPSIFIIIGLVFIFSKPKGKGWNSSTIQSPTGDDYIDYIHVFSGGERQIISDNFKGGKITAVFGGSEIDLTKSRLAQGVVDLEIACVFGGITIIVPDEWNVKIEITPVLGGFEDSRKFHPGRTIDMSHQLVLRGTVVFGGGEIKSY
ncbi:MAG TPA: DUF5668 domain-containing protein [Bacteroidales bacterium]|nr:DUF5668 domain-containing protein [Bacteroidales bacterium]